MAEASAPGAPSLYAPRKEAAFTAAAMDCFATLAKTAFAEKPASGDRP